ncbi:MIP/aquaporin family protein [Pseudochrobactrum kiredjianiae]|uniref:MIP/aquaporin family protein n=1 Tax=Pseudochrobactrum kiredjianiae TaxID=386305 RepID=A0ABW3V0S6_9HYPH|nr:MIP/aquaporin family protein [Pseudochrobactrum kiredjianiae]MDM7852064.1 MIP/aquaporin family protein [Pseudochrobactrum kiredjianiae]
MPNGFMGEFLGTTILILLGNGTVANVLLKKSKGYASGWIVITAGWGFAVLCGALIALSAGSAAHLNPAVTLAFYAAGSFPADQIVTYLTAQFCGAFFGSVLVYLSYLSHWKETESCDDKLAVFCTIPAIRNLPANAVTEITGTFVLVLIIIALSSKAVLASGVSGPLMVGLLVWVIGLSLGGPTGYAINPARDLAPRFAHALLPISGKGSSQWSYALVPLIAPVIGGLIAVGVAKSIAMI